MSDRRTVKYWEIIADISAKPDGVEAALQLKIAKRDRSGLLTHIATTESVSLCTPLKH